MKLLNFINHLLKRSPKTEPSTEIEDDFSNINKENQEVIAPKSDDNRVRYKKYTYNDPYQNESLDSPSRKFPLIRLRTVFSPFFNNKVGTPYSNPPLREKIFRVGVQPPHYCTNENEFNVPNDPSIFFVKSKGVNKVEEAKDETSFLQKLSCCTTNPKDVVDPSAKYKV